MALERSKLAGTWFAKRIMKYTRWSKWKHYEINSNLVQVGEKPNGGRIKYETPFPKESAGGELYRAVFLDSVMILIHLVMLADWFQCCRSLRNTAPQRCWRESCTTLYYRCFDVLITRTVFLSKWSASSCHTIIGGWMRLWFIYSFIHYHCEDNFGKRQRACVRWREVREWGQNERGSSAYLRSGMLTRTWPRPECLKALRV